MSVRRAIAVATLALAVSACAQPPRGAVEPAPPAAQGDSVFVAGEAGTIDAVGRDGTLRWRYDFGAALAKDVAAATPDVTIAELASSGDDVFALVRSDTGATAGASYLVAVSADGRERWRREVGPPAEASRPLAVERAAYLAFADGTLGAFSLTDGAPLWSFAVSGAGPGSPHIGADGTVYVRGANGRLHAVGPDGAERWAYPNR